MRCRHVASLVMRDVRVDSIVSVEHSQRAHSYTFSQAQALLHKFTAATNSRLHISYVTNINKATQFFATFPRGVLAMTLITSYRSFGEMNSTI